MRKIKKNAKGFILLMIAFILVEAQAQAPNKQWDNTLGGTAADNMYPGTSSEQTSDGGYIVIGTSFSGASGDKSEISRGGADFWLVKLDGLGNKVWDKTYGGSADDYAYSVKQTSDGGYVVGGRSNSAAATGDKSSLNKGLFDYWILKLDASGNIQWDKTFGGTSDDYLNDLGLTSDGGYILAGWSSSAISADKSSNPRGSRDFWIVKLDGGGNKQWDKTYGGSSVDEGYSINQTSDGGYFLGGHSYSGITGDKTDINRGPSDYWVLRLDATGNKIWDKTLGGGDDDVLFSTKQTSDGGFVLGGYSRSPVGFDKSDGNRGTWDYWLIKLDGSGTKQWDKTYGGNGSDIAYSVMQTSDGGLAIFGYSGSAAGPDKSESSAGIDYWLVKTDDLGNKIWDATLGGIGADIGSSALQTSDDGYLMAGYSNSMMSTDKSEDRVGGGGTDNFDYWIVKLEGTLDTEVPVISGIPDNGITLNSYLDECGAVVSWEEGSTGIYATDNIGVTGFSYTTSPVGYTNGSEFPIGTTTVTYTAIDAAGNSTSSSFTIIVADAQSPVINNMPSNILLTTCVEIATWAEPSATDNCSGVSLTRTGPASGSAFANGSATSITYTATDASGNQTSSTFTVTRADALSASIATSNPYLYFGLSGNQSAIITAMPAGGTAPYTISITMIPGATSTLTTRPLLCDVVNSAGDEVWVGEANTASTTNACGVVPVSVSIPGSIAEGGSYSVTVTLLEAARFVATVTDATGCSYTIPIEQAVGVDAEDVRCFAGSSSNQKVQLCHKTGSSKNPCVTICVDESAIAEHLAHGDFYGECPPSGCAQPSTNARIASDLVAEAVDSSVEAYPNPFKSSLSIQVSNPDNLDVKLTMKDMVGRNIDLRIPAPSQQGLYVLGTDGMQPGLYVIQINIGRFSKTIKVLKE